MNDRGQIAGAVGDFAARWDSFALAPTTLAPLGGLPFSVSKGINDRGTVAGDSDAANFAPYATLWYQDGRARRLESGFGPGKPSELFAINDRNQVTGVSYLTSAPDNSADSIVREQATRWSPRGRPRLIALLPGTNVDAGLTIDAKGDVVGGAAHVDLANGQGLAFHALVWFGHGAPRTLPVPGLTYEGSRSNALDIDGRGTVVGSSGPAGGMETPTVWTCAQRQAYVPAVETAGGRRTTAARPGARVGARSLFERNRWR